MSDAVLISSISLELVKFLDGEAYGSVDPLVRIAACRTAAEALNQQVMAQAQLAMMSNALRKT